MKQAYLRRGFTLIEIMVVIGIIAILSSVLYVSFGDARTSARDKALVSEIKEVQLALELYKAQNGQYPLPKVGAGCASGSAPERVAKVNECPGYLEAIVPNFIAEAPDSADSPNENCNIVYRTDSAGTWYKLTAVRCYASGDIDQDNELARCPSSCNASVNSPCHEDHANFSNSYAVYSAGGQCH